MRVVISNVYADDNRGGAAITAATIAAVRDAFPESVTTLIAVRGDPTTLRTAFRHTAARHPELRVLPPPVAVSPGHLAGLRAFLLSLSILLAPSRVRRADPSLEAIRDADLIVSKGGDFFTEREGLRGVLSLWITTLPLLIGARRGIPTVVYCSTVGPFTSRSSRAVSRFILRRVSLVMAREPLSYEAGLELGLLPHRLRCVDDSVFSLDPPSRRLSDELVLRFGLGGERFAALTACPLSGSPQTERLVSVLAEAVRLLLDEGCVDRILVPLQVDGPSISDRAMSERLVALADDSRVTLVDADLSPEELMALYGAAEVVIACRLHSAIFSMVAGTPAVPIATRGRKALGVYTALGLDSLVLSPEGLTARVLVDVVAGTIADREALSSRLRRIVAETRQRSTGNVTLLRAIAER